MPVTTKLTESLEIERKSLSRYGRLHWFHWVIVALSLVLTFGAWYYAQTQVNEKSLVQFDREASHTLELVQERMRKYEDALWGGIAAIQTHGGAIEYSQWKKFADSLHIETKYPGISGIGVIESVEPGDLPAYIENQRRDRPDFRVHPEHSRPEYLPIVYIEPEGPNLKAVGLDMAHETNRYTAAVQARATGTAQITGPIFLVQDAVRTPGFLFYAPYYRNNIQSSVQERRENFLGMVYAPFTVSRLMAGTLRKELRRVGIQLSDGAEELYNENIAAEPDHDSSPLFQTTETLEFYGRTWTFNIMSTKSFREANESHQPILILLGGIIIDSLLLGLFLLLSRSNRKALDFADRMTEELRLKADQLSESNADLERLAYVTSHDLKTPLRGITDLASYIKEDLDEYSGSGSGHPEINHNLERIHQQTFRMENLINGILDYSSVGSRPESVESTHVEKIIEALARETGSRRDQLVIAGTMPVFDTYRVRFTQVMDNLVGNAFKYHPKLAHALVTVACVESDGFYEFSVTDNGPGIDPKFHSRIFEVFQTLQTRDDVESTGIGLSIVKKSVESIGGSISVFSKLGEGTTFQFRWPKVIQSNSDSYLAVK